MERKEDMKVKKKVSGCQYYVPRLIQRFGVWTRAVGKKFGMRINPVNAANPDTVLILQASSTISSPLNEFTKNKLNKRI